MDLQPKKNLKWIYNLKRIWNGFTMKKEFEMDLQPKKNLKWIYNQKRIWNGFIQSKKNLNSSSPPMPKHYAF